MKKVPFLAIAGFSALMVSGTAMAFPQLGSGPNPVTIVDCPLLANDISIVASNNVQGGINCDEENNIIALTMCHSTGSTISRSAVVTQNEAGTVTCVISDTENCVDTVTGAAFPTGNTENGTVASQYPGGACTAETAFVVAGGILPEEEEEVAP